VWLPGGLKGAGCRGPSSSWCRNFCAARCGSSGGCHVPARACLSACVYTPPHHCHMVLQPCCPSLLPPSATHHTIPCTGPHHTAPHPQERVHGSRRAGGAAEHAWPLPAGPAAPG
jgi:hypothetical protein